MILVTGGTGLIGSHLLLKLRQKGFRVKALKREDSSIAQVKCVFKHHKCNELLEDVEWVSGDILDVPSLEKAFEGVDQVYHCAGYVSFNNDDRERLYKINVEGTANVVNVALQSGVKKLCHVSSVSVYSNTKSRIAINESIDWKNDPTNSYYAISKYGGEREAWRGLQEGLPTLIVTPTVVLGVSNKPNSSYNLLSFAKKGPRFYPPGCTGFVDAADLSNAMVELMNMEAAAGRYLINGHNKSYKEFFIEACTTLKKKQPSIQIPNWALKLALTFSGTFATLFGLRKLLSKDMIRAVMTCKEYDNAKLVNTISFRPTSFKQTISNAASEILF